MQALLTLQLSMAISVLSQWSDWQPHMDLSLPQVSSYGGHLRYQLHSNPRRGDVFIPMESRPDVILKVQPRKSPGAPC